MGGGGGGGCQSKISGEFGRLTRNKCYQRNFCSNVRTHLFLSNWYLLRSVKPRRRTRNSKQFKMSSSEIFTCKGTLRQVFICLRPRTPYPPSAYTMFTYIQYTYSHREGGEGGELIETDRRGEGQQFTKLGRKYQHDWLHLQSINSYKHLPQSLFIQVHFYRCRHFVFVSLYCS